jgi:hypothetical protein
MRKTIYEYSPNIRAVATSVKGEIAVILIEVQVKTNDWFLFDTYKTVYDRYYKIDFNSISNPVRTFVGIPVIHKRKEHCAKLINIVDFSLEKQCIELINEWIKLENSDRIALDQFKKYFS